MKTNFSIEDKKFMSLALEEAKKSFEKDNFPCGAVLVVDDKIIGKSENKKETKEDRISHAEMLLYIQHSDSLKKAKKQGSIITMYTTLEPCLMCFGSAVMHRVSRIVASAPDPLGNMSQIDGKRLGQFYHDKLPQLEYGLEFQKSYGLIKSYLLKSNDDESRNYVQLFENLRRSLDL